MGLPKEKIIEILKQHMDNVSWITWQNKQSILFHLRAVYGDDLFDMEVAGILYDSITQTEEERRNNES